MWLLYSCGPVPFKKVQRCLIRILLQLLLIGNSGTFCARDSNFLCSAAINDSFLNRFSDHFLNPRKCLASTVYCGQSVVLLFSIGGISDWCSGIIILTLSIHLLIFLNTGFVFLLLPATGN